MKFLWAILLFGVAASACFAQSADSLKVDSVQYPSAINNYYHDTYGFVLGIGACGVNGTPIGAYAAGMFLSYHHDFSILSLRYIGSEGAGGGLGGTAVKDFGVLYGVGIFSKVNISLSVGLSYLEQTVPSYYAHVVPNAMNSQFVMIPAAKSSLLCLSNQIKIFGNISDNCGIGFLYFGDLNRSFSRDGWLLAFEFGLL